MADFPTSQATLAGLTMSIEGGQIPVQTLSGARIVFAQGRAKWRADLEIAAKPGADIEVARIAVEDWIAQFRGLAGTNTIDLTAAAGLRAIPAGKVVRPESVVQQGGRSRYTVKTGGSSGGLDFYWPKNGEHLNVTVDGRARLFRVIDAGGGVFSVAPDTGAIPVGTSGAQHITNRAATLTCQLRDGGFALPRNPQFAGPWTLSVLEA